MQASLAGFAVAANNLANINTPAFRPQRYNAASGAVTPLQPRPAANALPNAETGAPSNVDPARELVDLHAYVAAFRANSQVVRLAERLQKQALDILA
jgi:flagellar basal body rod protein FlgG